MSLRFIPNWGVAGDDWTRQPPLSVTAGKLVGRGSGHTYAQVYAQCARGKATSQTLTKLGWQKKVGDPVLEEGVSESPQIGLTRRKHNTHIARE